MKFLTILLVFFLALSLVVAFSARVEEVRESCSFSRFRNRSRFLNLFPVIRYLSKIKIISTFINSIKVNLPEKRQIDFRLELSSEKHKNSPPLEYFILSFLFVLFFYFSFLCFKSSLFANNSLIKFLAIFVLIAFLASLFLPNISMMREELREESGLGNIFRLNSRRMMVQISCLKNVFISLINFSETNIFKEKVMSFRNQLASEKRKTSPPHLFGFLNLFILFPLCLFLPSVNPLFSANIFFNPSTLVLISIFNREIFQRLLSLFLKNHIVTSFLQGELAVLDEQLVITRPKPCLLDRRAVNKPRCEGEVIWTEGLNNKGKALLRHNKIIKYFNF
jgi:hypothetical protein